MHVGILLLWLFPQSVKQRLGRVNPGVQLGSRPQRVSLDSRPSVLRLRSGAPDGWFLGRRRCPCALWGLRLASRRYGWAGQVLRARPLKRTGFNPKSTWGFYALARSSDRISYSNKILNQFYLLMHPYWVKYVPTDAYWNAAETKLGLFGGQPVFRQRWVGDVREMGTTSTTPRRLTWQHAPKQGLTLNKDVVLTN